MKAVLFDLDDTLFDHTQSARAALASVHRVHAAECEFDLFERHHQHYLEEMHQEVLAGRMALDDARRERFRRVFAAIGLDVDEPLVDTAAASYRNGYMSVRRAIDGAADLLAAVRPHARIAIVSNNLIEEQRDKLLHCGLSEFVDALVVSEEVGTSKPDPRIFHVALERLGVTAADAVMLGDQWATDIVGAVRAGISAFWFNPSRKARPSDASEFDDVGEIHTLRPADTIARLLLRMSR